MPLLQHGPGGVAQQALRVVHRHGHQHGEPAGAGRVALVGERGVVGGQRRLVDRCDTPAGHDLRRPQLGHLLAVHPPGQEVEGGSGVDHRLDGLGHDAVVVVHRGPPVHAEVGQHLRRQRRLGGDGRQAGACARQAGVGEHQAGETVGMVGHDPPADQAAPVLPEERHVLQVEVPQQFAHPGDVAAVGVGVLVHRLVRPAEADQIGHDHTAPGGHQRRDHRPVEVAPHRLAVEQEYGLAVAAVPFVGRGIHVRHPQAAFQREVAGRPRVVGDGGEAVLRGPQHLPDAVDPDAVDGERCAHPSGPRPISTPSPVFSEWSRPSRWRSVGEHAACTSSGRARVKFHCGRSQGWA